MPRHRHHGIELVVLSLLAVLAFPGRVVPDNDNPHPEPLPAEVVATGIPGAGAVMQVGTFQQGSPLRDNPTWIPFTAPGAVLHHDRILVASISNFGAPLAQGAQYEGSVISLDVASGLVEVPPSFAVAGGQASALGGRVILYTANSDAFRNDIHNPSAVTASEVAASLPLGISFNSGHGRPWLANAPRGSSGDGTITVLDGNGRPLAGAPSVQAGGVFAGIGTNRTPFVGPGLGAGALATALITKSPDNTNRAVFFAALADGSVAQVHVQKGVDGLAPAGTFTPLPGITPTAAASTSPDEVTRVGMVFNWAPTRNVFLTDPLANRIVVLDLGDDHTIFTATVRYFHSGHYDRPVDIAPATVEVGTRNFCSNTTLGVGSDLYVLNRGDNSIVRIDQTGKLLAVREIVSPVAGFRAAGLGVSPDARTLWISGTVPGGGGVLLKASAFGQGAVTESILAGATAGNEVAQGTDIFDMAMDVPRGLGPLFNGESCSSCHFAPSAGGMGTSAESFVVRVARIRNGRFDDLEGRGGPITRQLVVDSCGLPTGVPPTANATSVRSAMTLRGTTLLDFIREVDVDAVREQQPPALRGRKNLLVDGRMGRFGWKAQSATLIEFIGEALRDEMGVTNAIRPLDLANGCGANNPSTRADAVAPTALVAFLNQIDPPPPTQACLDSAGAAVFASIGCATCHTPSFSGPGSRQIRAYTDLLLHDMGSGLADGFEQGSATGSEFRSAPLWRVSDRLHFLHDGRASSIPEAIDAHGGQAAAAAAAFGSLGGADRQALLDFLGCI